MMLAALALAACGEEAAREAREPEREDALRLLEVFAADPTREVLREADAAFDDDRPVQAAQILRDRGVPAAREALAAAEAAEVRTAAGARARAALVEAYRARVAALEGAAAALDRGMVEDLALLDALRAEREAEERILEAQAAIEALRSPGEGAENR